MHPKIIHVLGTSSGIGKSSLCLGLLAWLLERGIPAKELAYIKPMTQCVDRQPVAVFCGQYGIACEDTGPVIFSKGFTREYLYKPMSEQRILLDKVLTAIHAIGSGRQYLFVDGVGHPAVGSTLGLSNITLTNALANPKVLLVGPAGIGAAIDSVALRFLAIIT